MLELVRMGKFIRPEGWHNWGKESNEKTARYYEYKNYSPGSQTEGRVKWSKVLSKKEAKAYKIKKVFPGWQVEKLVEKE